VIATDDLTVAHVGLTETFSHA